VLTRDRAEVWREEDRSPPLLLALPVLGRGENEYFVVHEIGDFGQEVGGFVALKEVLVAIGQGNRNGG
jgi:hypothetical protein